MTQSPDTEGSVGFLAVPALLRDLRSRFATGQFVVSRGSTVKKLFLKSGAVVFANSNHGADRLGDVLLARGMITRYQYEESASQVLATGRKQGTVLVQIGALTPKDLFQGLIAQVREIVVSLFGWDRGRWRFIEGLPAQEEIVTLRLSVAELILEGLRRLAGDPRLGAVWSPGQVALRPLGDSEKAVADLELPDDARRLLTLAEQGRGWDEIRRLAGVEEAEASALLYGLVLLGLVGAEREEPGAAVAAPTGPDPGETLRMRQRITDLAGKLPSLNHYQVLGLTPQSDRDTIKRTYIALAKEFHPDRYFLPGLEDLQDQVNALFMRINGAYTTLSNAASRAEYDRETLRLSAPGEREKDPQQDSRLAGEQYKKGRALLEAQDYWNAIQAFRWAVNLNPQNPSYHNWLGVALTRTKKRLHEAEEHCKTAIALDYNNPEYYVNLGLVYRAGHLKEKARKQFELALKLDPKHAPARRELEDLKESTGEKGLLGRFLGK